MRKLISVCMCTYKRLHLKKTLESIVSLKLPNNYDIEIIVVDNDELQTGKVIVDNFECEYGVDVKYISEPKKNIAIARNAYLQVANGEWIATIDDDEIADRLWLYELVGAAIEFEADVVFGNVKAHISDAAPDWIKKCGFFDRKVYTTGTVVTSGGTASTLIRSLVLAENRIRFDESFGHTGGEDSDLFHRLHLLGYKLIYSQEAYVSEDVELDRLNLNYIVKRAMRVGQTYSRYRYGDKSDYITKAIYLTKCHLKLIFMSCMLLLTCVRGKSIYVKYLVKVADSIGKIGHFVTDKKIEQYK